MAITYKVFVNGVFQGTTEDTTWSLNRIYKFDQYGDSPPTDHFSGLQSGEGYTWQIESDSTEPPLFSSFPQIWSFNVAIPQTAPPGILPIPSDRPDGYDPDLPWNDAKWTWDVSFLVAGGGRYQSRLVAISQEGNVFIEDL